MRRFMLLTGCALALLLGGAVSAAQPVTVPVAQPIHGHYVFGVAETRLMLLDTFTGEARHLDEFDSPTGIRHIALNSQGDQVAYDAGPEVRILNLFDNSLPRTVMTVSVETGRFSVQDWSQDSKQLLGLVGLTDWDYEEVQAMNASDGTRTTLAHFDYETVISQVPGDRKFARGLINAQWNPTYPEWVAIQMYTYCDAATLLCEGSTPVIILNLQTGQGLVTDDLLSGTIDPNQVAWSPDGQYLAVASYEPLAEQNHLYILELREGSGGWELALVDSVEKDNTLHLEGWLGVEDLLLMVTYDQVATDLVLYVARIVEDELQTTEFFRVPDEIVGSPHISNGDWHLAATPEEQAALSCLFDATQPARLAVGGQGQVAFTGGTPSRLRDAPGLDGAQVALMAEGTPFDVIGGPWCADGYRWWQLQLADGTQGWSAEADAAGYFLE